MTSRDVSAKLERPQVSVLSMNRWRRLCALGWLLLSVGSCTAGSGTQARTAIDWGDRPPPNPGSSITHTRLCACTACVDRACCAGADESQASCEDDAVIERVDGDEATIDFSGSDACGVEVRSCERSCERKVWRTASGASCAASRPPECCEQ